MKTEFNSLIEKVISKLREKESVSVIDLDSEDTLVTHVDINDQAHLVISQLTPKSDNPDEKVIDRVDEVILALKVNDKDTIVKLNKWLNLISMQITKEEITDSLID